MSTTVEEALSCHLCLDIFKDPVQLSCTHSLCLPCLEQLTELASGTVLQCPECREMVEENHVTRNDLLASIVDFYWEMSARADRNYPARHEGQQRIPDANQQLKDGSKTFSENDEPEPRKFKDASQKPQVDENSYPNTQEHGNNLALRVSSNVRNGDLDPSYDDHRLQNLELQLKQLRQVQHQETVQQQHLQSRLRQIQSQLQLKKLRVLRGQQIGPPKEWQDIHKISTVLAQFENTLKIYGQTMKEVHESQLKGLQLSATRVALNSDKLQQKVLNGNKGNRPEVTKEHNSRQVSEIANKISSLEPVQEQSREQIEKQIKKVQQTFDQSQHEHQNVFKQLQVMKQKHRSKWQNLDTKNPICCEHFQQREKDLLLFEAKMNQFQKLQANLYFMKLQHLHEKLDKMN